MGKRCEGGIIAAVVVFLLLTGGSATSRFINTVGVVMVFSIPFIVLHNTNGVDGKDGYRLKGGYILGHGSHCLAGYCAVFL